MKKVFLLGVFDLIHKGHVALLERASASGDLCVGVICDSAVKIQKGKDRPIICEEDRMYMVSKIKGVTDVELVFGFYFPKHRIESSDIIIVGGDQDHILNTYQIPEYKKLVLPRTEGISTGEIVRKIRAE